MPVTNVMKWYKGDDDMPLTDVFRLSESTINKLSASVKDNFGLSLCPMLAINGHSYMVSDLVNARIYSLPSQNYRIEFYQLERMCFGKSMLVVYPHSNGIHYCYAGQVDNNEELRSGLLTLSYGIVDMGDSDLIPLLDKIGMSIDVEWGCICSTYVNLS